MIVAAAVGVAGVEKVVVVIVVPLVVEIILEVVGIIPLKSRGNTCSSSVSVSTVFTVNRRQSYALQCRCFTYIFLK